jgi:hypothetical protein
MLMAVFVTDKGGSVIPEMIEVARSVHVMPAFVDL